MVPLHRFVLQMVAQGLFPSTKPQPITPIYEPATVGKDKAQYIGVKLM